MNRQLLSINIAALALVTLSLGCSGNGNSPVLSGLENNPTLQALTPDSLKTHLTGDRADGAERSARGEAGERGKKGHRGRGDRLMKLLQDDCATVTGDPKAGGSAVFANCEVRGGTLTGNVTWSGDQDASEDGFSSSTTKQVTYVKTGEDAGLQELGPARMWAEELGIQLLPDVWDRAEINSSMSSSGTKGDRESFRRTGTTTINIFDGATQARTITVVWNAPVDVTLTVDGTTHVIDLSEVREKMKDRIGEFRQKREKQHAEVDSASTPELAPASDASTVLTGNTRA